MHKKFSHDWHNFFIEQKNLFSYTRSLPQVNKQQKILVDFSTNDYLGINHIPRLKNEVFSYLNSYINTHNCNIGSTGSRLLSGNTSSHIELEKLISQTKGYPQALIFSSGYQANISVLSAILHPIASSKNKHKIKLFSDKSNHASLHTACKALNIKQIRYNHLDLAHLKKRLDENVEDNDLVYIVTESVFGMDGDITDINTLVKLAKQYNALLYIDEAHASGILGKDGYGLASNLFSTYSNIIVMGTFSKALGTSGAYIVCSSEIKDYLINACGGFIYSTAPSPLIMQATYYIWEKLPQLEYLRQHIQELSIYIKQNLINLGFNIGKSIENFSNIIPIIIGKVENSTTLYNYLLQHNIKTSHIRPPTVSLNSSRIRLSICAYHTKHDIDILIKILHNYINFKGLIY